jgi:hypothetical protein
MPPSRSCAARDGTIQPPCKRGNPVTPETTHNLSLAEAERDLDLGCHRSHWASSPGA